MKCENCKASVSPEFTFAIKNNQCPACGKNIMHAGELENFLSLKSIISSNFNSIDCDRAASLIMANFELKLKNNNAIGNDAQHDTIDEDATEEFESDGHDNGNSNIKSITSDPKLSEVKAISEKLKKLREEALHDAEVEHWGLGDANMISDADSVYEIVQNQKKQGSYERVVSGSGGKNSFSRGG